MSANLKLLFFGYGGSHLEDYIRNQILAVSPFKGLTFEFIDDFRRLKTVDFSRCAVCINYKLGMADIHKVAKVLKHHPEACIVLLTKHDEWAHADWRVSDREELAGYDPEDYIIKTAEPPENTRDRLTKAFGLVATT